MTDRQPHVTLATPISERVAHYEIVPGCDKMVATRLYLRPLVRMQVLACFVSLSEPPTIATEPE